MKRTPLRKRGKNAGKRESRDNRWRKEVMRNSGYMCAVCGKPYDFESLEAHHIIPKGGFPEGRYVLENGIALCREHHVTGEKSVHNGKIDVYDYIRYSELELRELVREGEGTIIS